jgi:predicted nucleotide-binding protein
MEWSKAVAETKKASPYIGEILDKAFNEADAVVVLLTPDEQARLKKKFITSKDPETEGALQGQPRPNVLFEAGMAFGRHHKSTVLVQVGIVRPFSDIAGLHLVHLTNHAESRADLANKLRNAGCAVNTDGTDWMSEGDFDLN